MELAENAHVLYLALITSHLDCGCMRTTESSRCPDPDLFERLKIWNSFDACLRITLACGCILTYIQCGPTSFQFPWCRPAKVSRPPYSHKRIIVDAGLLSRHGEVLTQ